MYWTDVMENTIKRAKLDGTELTTVVDDGLQTPGNLILEFKMSLKALNYSRFIFQ